MTAVAGLMSWFGISVTYIRFYAGLKAQGFDRTALPFSSRLQPFLGWYGVFSTIFICFVRASPASSPSPSLTFTIVQRMERVPQGRLGDGYVCNQLHSVGTLPHHVLCVTDLAADVVH